MPIVDANGARLHYEREGHGPPVFFIQGVGVAGCGWKPQTESLRHRFDCVSYDHRGIGESTGPTEGLSIELLVEDAIALLDALGWERAHVVGHSMGGVIAHQLALDHPQRVRTLSLLCTFSRGKEALSLSPRMLGLGLRSRIGTVSMRRNAFAEMVMPRAYLESRGRASAVAQLEEVFGRDLAEAPEVVSRQLEAMRRHDASERLPELASIPTLVMVGSHDPIARPEFGMRLSGAIGSARYVEFDDASHALPIQHPQAVNELLAEHFARA